MAAYITIAYVRNAIGTNETNKLIDDDTSVMDQLISDASAKVDAALDQVGYSVPLGDPPQLVKIMTLGALLGHLYGRKGLQIPLQFADSFGIFKQVKKGELRVPGLKAKKLHATGGSKWSQATAGNKEPIFDKLRNLY